jgi:CO/xanthine dehydrogenase FAD-binding subunit
LVVFDGGFDPAKAGRDGRNGVLLQSGGVPASRHLKVALGGRLQGGAHRGIHVRGTPGLRSGYDKIRIRRSIEYPVAGAAVALRREGGSLAALRVAITGTNPRPVLLQGTDALCGGPLDNRIFAGLDELVRDQIMAMKTTFTPGHYRRRVAGVLARRLMTRLFNG